MARLMIAWCFGVMIPAAAPGDPALTRFHFSQTEMAVPIELVLYAPSAEAATRGAQAVFGEFHRLNGLLSDYDPESELSRLSRTSGEGKVVAVGEDLWSVLRTAQAISEKSGGSFDVTVGPVVRLWRRARRHHELPPAEQIAAALKAVGYRYMRLIPESHAVQLLKPGMRLDLGGIAKGYAVGRAMQELRKLGLGAAMIEAGGDIGLGDPPPGKPGWRIGIAPLDLKAPPSQYLWLSRCAVSTSGDTWQYVEIGGRRYSHVVDPHTGIGLTDHCSVTIVYPQSTIADALGKAVAVLGPEKGLKLIDDFPGAAAYVIRAPGGSVQIYQSRRWKDLPVAPRQ